MKPSLSERAEADDINASSETRPSHATAPAPTPAPSTTPVTVHQAKVNSPRAPPPAPVEEEDDLSVTPEPGTRCRHKGCNAEFVSNEESRGENAICTYHPSQVSKLVCVVKDYI